MRRILVTALLAFAVAPVAASVAAGGSDATKNASVACTAIKSHMLAADFAHAYGTFGGCVSALTPVEKQNVASAQAACTAEQSDATFTANHGGKTFAQFYGTGKGDKNALAKCVSTKAQAASKAEQLARTNPARTCRTLRTQLVANTFIATFGTARNAFGKCTSWAAGLQTQSENAASATCRTAQDASATTFAANYTSNADAFGKCVSSTASAQAKAKLQATIAAVSACKAEQTNLAAFNAKYGSFKSCVAQKTKTA